MLSRLFRRPRRSETIAAALYGAIVTQARAPAFYRDIGVPDSVEGRLEMVLLHMVLLMRRLRPEEEAGRRLGQEVFDAFVADMDGSLREMGVGDLSVPKRMKAIGRRFYGRLEAYGPALAAGDRTALAAALARNLGPAGASAKAGSIADYAVEADQLLASRPIDAICRGALAFPSPMPHIVDRETLGRG